VCVCVCGRGQGGGVMSLGVLHTWDLIANKVTDPVRLRIDCRGGGGWGVAVGD
jgi:hypothetical protein